MKVLVSALTFFLLSSTFAADPLQLNATYTIPTTSSEEIPYATFKLENYVVNFLTVNDRPETVVTYTLPSEMVGSPKEIKMKLVIENGATRVLEGEEAIALCSGKWVAMKCDVRFKKLDIDLLKVESKLESLGMESSEISERLQLLSKFSGDPIGVSQVLP